MQDSIGKIQNRKVVIGASFCVPITTYFIDCLSPK